MAITKVLMPKLSETMESGKIVKWIKKEGDRIQAGDILAEVETDKANVEMEAFGAGVLRKILVPAGSTVPVGSLIGVIAEPDEDIAAVAGPAGRRPRPHRPSRHRAAARTPSPASAPSAACASGPRGGSGARAAARGHAAARRHAESRARRRRAAEGLAARAEDRRAVGLDLHVSRAADPAAASCAATSRQRRPRRTAAAARPVAVAAVAPGVEFEDRPLSQIRAAIAKRMPRARRRCRTST